MKKKFILLSLFGIAMVQAQVGINTDNPSATLEVKVKKQGSSVDVKGVKVSNSDLVEIDNLYGVHIDALKTGKLSNYGLYIEDVGKNTATENYSIYTGKGAVSFGDYVNIRNTNDVNLTTKTPAFMIGNFETSNLAMDNNEIQARNNGMVSDLVLQGEGGNILFNAQNTDETKKFVFYGDTGNVSLGGWESTQKLDVNGNARFRGLPSVSGAATDKVVVVDNTGVLKTVERSSVGGSSTTYTAGTGISIENNVVSTKTPLRVITDDNVDDHSSHVIQPSDNGGYIYVDVKKTHVEFVFSSDLPVGFSCVIVQKGDGRVILDDREVGKIVNGKFVKDEEASIKIESARGGHTTRAKYSAIGIIKDTPTTVTVTGDAE